MKLCAAFFALSLVAPVTASGEVYLLVGGGRVEGELVNADESPREKYVIKTGAGATVTIAADRVQKVLTPRANEVEYERIRPTYPDTVEGQWALAEWCREHRMPAAREPHLRRVIELEPNHAQARHALGYVQIDGQWTRQKELMESRGLVNYHGLWKTPQEVELLEHKHQMDLAQGEWMKKVKLWRSWIGGNRDQQARDSIRSIHEPAAAKALGIALRDDAHTGTGMRLLIVETLSRLDTSAAARALAEAAIYDPEDEVRQTCLDHLQTKKSPEATSYFVARLKDKKNEIVNLAGIALGRLKDPAAVGPLIEALVTTHKFDATPPGGDNSMNAGFTNRGGLGGLSVGGGHKVVHKQMANQAVLDALVAITGRNYNFDKQEWRHWFAGQKKPSSPVNTRRDKD